MRYLKIFEHWESEYYDILLGDEDGIIDWPEKSVDFSKIEENTIRDFIGKLDKGLCVRFGRYSPTNSVRIGLLGEDLDSHFLIEIYKSDDDWFFISSVSPDDRNNGYWTTHGFVHLSDGNPLHCRSVLSDNSVEFAKCDQLDGVVEYLKKYFDKFEMPKLFEGMRQFREYGVDYRKPVMVDLEDYLIEIFDKYKIIESPIICNEYSWWNDCDRQITIGNIPSEDIQISIRRDIERILSKIKNRLQREIIVQSGDNGRYRNTYWVSISPK